MTTTQFDAVWDETLSYLSHTVRAADSTQALAPATRDTLKRSLLVAIDMLSLAKRNSLSATALAAEKEDS